MLNAVAVVLGLLLLAAGASWVYPPAGLIVLGLCLAALGLYLDDGA